MARIGNKGLFVREDAVLADVLFFLMDSTRNDRERLLAKEVPGGFELHWASLTVNRRNEVGSARTCLKRLVDSSLPPGGKGRPYVETRTHADGSQTMTTFDGSYDQLRWECHKNIDSELKLNAGALRKVLPMFAERMHRVITSNLASAQVNTQEAPRPAGDCMAHWMDVLERSTAQLPAHSVHRRTCLEMLKQDVRERWLAHDVNPLGLADHFNKLTDWCKTYQLPDLAKLSARLSLELLRGAEMKARAANQIGAGDDGGTAMRARDYGSSMKRAWEQALVYRLLKNTPPGVIYAADRFRYAHFRRLLYLATKEPWAFARVAHSIHRDLNSDRRPSAVKIPSLKKFLDASAESAPGALLDYLSESINSADRCVPVYLLNAPLYKAIRTHAPHYLTWATSPSHALEHKTLNKARDRTIKDSDVVQGSGILQAHMPPMDDDPHKLVFGTRPSNHYKPNLARPTPENALTLDHDMPYAAGPSGSTLLLAKAVHALNRENAGIDTRHAILGTFMAFLFDGGHSLNEVMWALNISKQGGVDMGIGGPYVEPRKFRADYRMFFNSFPMDTQRYLQDAQEYAYNSMLKYRRNILDKS